MSIIFYHDEKQRTLAIESKLRQEEKLERSIVTEIVHFSEFYLAEDYHQKYYLSSEPDLVKELRDIYPDMQSFIASTAAARLNGYAGGYGTPESLQGDLDNLGLSDAGKSRLLEIAERGLTPGYPVP